MAALPSNLLFRKIGPKVLVPSVIVMWGIVATLQGQQLEYLYLVIPPQIYTPFSGMCNIVRMAGHHEGVSGAG